VIGGNSHKAMLQVSLLSTPLYYIASIFPVASVMVCWILFYSLGHFTPGRVLTISETVVPFPECRIFSIAMCIESLFVFVIFSIRNLLFRAPAIAGGLGGDSKFQHFKRSMWVLTFGAAIGMIVVSVVTVANDVPVHMIGACTLFGCGAVYFVIGDFGLRFAKFELNMISWVLSWLALGLAVVFLVVNVASQGKVGVKNAASIFQYLLALSMFLKLFFSQYDLPPFYIKGIEDATQA
jgi:hypothetical protein